MKILIASKSNKQTLSLGTTNESVESVWVSMDHSLPQLDPDIRKKKNKTWTSSLEHLKTKTSRGL